MKHDEFSARLRKLADTVDADPNRFDRLVKALQDNTLISAARSKQIAPQLTYGEWALVAIIILLLL
jgi:hypothetical protein